MLVKTTRFFKLLSSKNLIDLPVILAETQRKSPIFVKAGTLQHAKDKRGEFKNGIVMILDPGNMGMDTLFVQLRAILAKI